MKKMKKMEMEKMPMHNDMSGQEQTDSGAKTDTPEKEARESTNDMEVHFEGPPPSGMCGVGYVTKEIPHTHPLITGEGR